MHSSLTPTFAGLESDESNIRSGYNTLSRLIPMIMASRAYRDGGLIIIWWEETEGDGAPGDNQYDFNHTLGEVIISPLARQIRMASRTPTPPTTPTLPICTPCRRSSK
jgi:phosphatidylinositol-3-phosphatase